MARNCGGNGAGGAGVVRQPASKLRSSAGMHCSAGCSEGRGMRGVHRRNRGLMAGGRLGRRLGWGRRQGLCANC